MKSTTALSILASAGLWLSSAYAAPVEANATSNLVTRDCKVNARELYSWVENGLDRYRIAYSGPASFVYKGSEIAFDARFGRQAWDEASGFCGTSNYNVQSYYNDVEKTLVIDDSEVRGPAGKSAIGCNEGRFIVAMMSYTGCGTD